ncbi:MAG: 30S ribosomal protein S4 [Anaerolineales bacterium]
MASRMRSNRESDFARQLRAKQRARRVYGVLERQFRRYYKTALKRRGLTGLSLLQILESRLDNVVYRLGFASSRAQARLLVTHGHFVVNGRRTDVPSMLLKEGDVISIREGSMSSTYFKELKENAEARTTPEWLVRDAKNLTGTVQRMPERAEIDGSLNEQLIVEYYSRR